MSATSILPPPPSGAGVTPEVYRWQYLVYNIITNLQAAQGDTGVFGQPGVTTPGEALVPSINRNLDYLSLGQLAINGAPVLSTPAEINQLSTSGIQRDTLQDLQSYSSGAHSVTITPDAETTNVIPVTIQFNGVNGGPSNQFLSGQFYLSSSSDGSSYSAVAPTGGIAATVGAINLVTTSVVGTLYSYITNNSGQLQINITDTTTGTWYICVIMPYGSITVSPPITFS